MNPSAPPSTDPMIIQGGMGVAVSDWRLANTVSAAGQLGVVSGTALEIVCARRLQDGDPGGHVRRALSHFPDQAVAEWVRQAYYVEGGIGPDDSYAAVPRWSLTPSRRLAELTVVGNFVEVFLAREGHTGPVGINYLRKIELPIPFAAYGAMLAGVDYVLCGAGNPAEIPDLVRRLARQETVSWTVRVQGATSADGDHAVVLDPRDLMPNCPAPATVPRVLAIVASHDLAAGLAGDPQVRPYGFVVEGPSAGGHNAPPRGPRRIDDRGQPVYDDRDSVDIPAIVGLGMPVWLAGSYGSPEGLRQALDLGATGVQLGTAFALSDESGLDSELKERVRAEVMAGTLSVRSDWRVSPTGFPFRVVEMEGTLSDPRIVEDRQKVCDLGALRSPYRQPDGEIGYRCPAEPVDVYIRRKGGREANTEGRTCLCNGLMAAAGHPQRRRNGYVEPAMLTAGSDMSAVAQLLEQGNGSYSATTVLSHLLAGIAAPVTSDA